MEGLSINNIAISQALGVLISFLVSKLKRFTFVNSNPKIAAAILSIGAALILHYWGNQEGGMSALVIYFIQQLATAVTGYEIAKNTKSGTIKAIKRFSTVILLSVFVFTQQACDKDQLRKIATKTERIAILLDAGIEAKRALGKTGDIDSAGELLATNALASVNSIVQQVNDRAQNYTELDQSTRAETIKLLQDAAAILDDLNAQGVLHIKNPDTQKRFQSAVSILSVALVTTSAFIPDFADPVKVEANPANQQIFERARGKLNANETKLKDDLARLMKGQGNQ